jgi:hypothetical protein
MVILEIAFQFDGIFNFWHFGQKWWERELLPAPSTPRWIGVPQLGQGWPVLP